MHKGTRHRGKVPTQHRRAHDTVEKVTRLEKELQNAIAKEDFEQAAVLRDEIKVAKGSGSSPNP